MKENSASTHDEESDSIIFSNQIICGKRHCCWISQMYNFVGLGFCTSLKFHVLLNWRRERQLISQKPTKTIIMNDYNYWFNWLPKYLDFHNVLHSIMSVHSKPEWTPEASWLIPSLYFTLSQVASKCLSDGADEYLQMLSLCSVIMQQASQNWNSVKTQSPPISGTSDFNWCMRTWLGLDLFRGLILDTRWWWCHCDDKWKIVWSIFICFSFIKLLILKHL